MAAKAPYMQFYPADYLADTIHLTTEEHGAYLLLMLNYWQTGRPLQVAKLCRIAGLSNDRWTAVEPVLSEFFVEDEGTWVHPRIEEDLARVKTFLKRQSDAGKKSALARKKKAKAKKAAAGKPEDTGDENTGSTDVEPRLNQASTKGVCSTKTEAETEPEAEADIKTPCSPPAGDVVGEIFEFWCSVMGKTKATRLTDGRRSKIKARLKNYSPEDIKRAVLGCASSDHHMGNNPDSNPEGVIYDDLTLICRNDEKLEWFMQREKAARRHRDKDNQLEDWIKQGQAEPAHGETLEGELA